MDTLFFIASKLLGGMLVAETWIIIALGMIVWALMDGRRRMALGVSGVSFLALLLLAIFPLGDLLLQPIERSYPANPPLERVDGIIILGGAEDIRGSAYWRQTQLNGSAERFTAAMALARRFPAARVVFTGGSGALSDVGGGAISEASAAEQFFRDQGLAPARLMLEGQSRNTAENARLSLLMAKPQSGDVFVLITSASHMPRAVRSFAAAGWPRLTPYPVDFRTSSFADGMGWNLPRNLSVLNIALKEHAGQIAYGLTGR